jgi:hypothetical protein
MTGGSDMEKSSGYFKLPILDYAFKLGCFLLSWDSRTVPGDQMLDIKGF